MRQAHNSVRQESITIHHLENHLPFKSPNQKMEGSRISQSASPLSVRRAIERARAVQVMKHTLSLRIEVGDHNTASSVLMLREGPTEATASAC
jgi:hypothetical protein